MKKLSVIFIIIILFVSCSVKRDYNLESYLLDSTYILSYRCDNNTLYGIKVPLDSVVEYGRTISAETVPEALEKYAGIKRDCLVTGTPDVLESVKTILGCWTEEKSADGYLKAIVSHSRDLSKQPLSSKINRLCSTDVTGLFRFLNEDTDVVYIDCSSFLDSDNAEYNRDYFELWIRQLLGE